MSDAQTEKRSISGRPVRFDLQRTGRHWLPGEVFATHFINVLHLLLPEGELWFCRVYQKALPAITDTALASDVRGFVQQEAIHGKTHRAVLEHYFRALMLDTAPYTDVVRFLFGTVLADRPLGISIPGAWLAHKWLVFRLGLIAVIEHFTCVLGQWMLSQNGLDRANADPAMLDLLRWHGAEEVEHRHVAHDLFVHAGGGYFMRVLLMGVVVPVLLALWFLGTRYFLAEDREGRQPFSVLWSWQRASGRGLLPSPWLLIKACLRYVLPGYHPEREADTHAALAYLAISPGIVAEQV